MALVYRFYLDTPTSVQDLITLIAQFLDAPIETRQNYANETIYSTTGPDILVSLVEESPEERADPDNLINVVAATYGFQLTRNIYMRIGKTDLGNVTMVEIVNHVLTHEPGDAVLHSELGMLLRRNGVLILDADVGFWRPAKLARLTLPYTWGHVPSL